MSSIVAISEERLRKVKSALKTIDSTFVNMYDELSYAVELYNYQENFPEDMTEDRTPWNELRENMSTFKCAFAELFTALEELGEKITKKEKQQ